MKHQYSIALAALTAILISAPAMPWLLRPRAPAGAFYEVYDFVVNKMLDGSLSGS